MVASRHATQAAELDALHEAAVLRLPLWCVRTGPDGWGSAGVRASPFVASQPVPYFDPTSFTPANSAFQHVWC